MTDMIQAAELALVNNDLGALTSEARLAYLRRLCESTGLNHLTQPFQYIKLNGRLTLYATKGCADQLRKVHGISIEILQNELVDGVIMVHARGTTPDGRTDEDIAVVPMRKGMDGINDRMKAITKAKRRLTLSICGLGVLDESELATIPTRAIEHVPVPEATRAVLSPPAPKVKAEPKPEPEVAPKPKKARTPAGNRKSFNKAKKSFEECGISEDQLLAFLKIEAAVQCDEAMTQKLRDAFLVVSRGQLVDGLLPATLACSDELPPHPGEDMAGLE